MTRTIWTVPDSANAAGAVSSRTRALSRPSSSLRRLAVSRWRSVRSGWRWAPRSSVWACRARSTTVHGPASTKHCSIIRLVVLREVDLSPEEHILLGEQFGEVEVHAFFPNLGPGHERISVLDSEDGTRSSMWHTDESFLERPPMGTLLHARMLPPVGGDTCWTSMTAAYETLSSSMQRYLESMTAEHGLSRIAEMKQRAGHAGPDEVAAAIADDRRATHPVVRVHPLTGARALLRQSYLYPLARRRPRDIATQCCGCSTHTQHMSDSCTGTDVLTATSSSGTTAAPCTSPLPTTTPAGACTVFRPARCRPHCPGQVSLHCPIQERYPARCSRHGRWS